MRILFVTWVAVALLVCPFQANATPHVHMQYDEVRIESNLAPTNYNQFEALFSKALKTHTAVSFAGPLNQCVASTTKNLLLANVQLDAALGSSHTDRREQNMRYDFRRSLAVARHSFLDGMERDDDLISHRAIIFRPDRKLVVFLDLRRKLYDEQPIKSARNAVGSQELPPTQAFSEIRYTERRFNVGYIKIAGERGKNFRVDSSMKMSRHVFGVFPQTLVDVHQRTKLVFLSLKEPRCGSMSFVNKTPGEEGYYRPDLRGIAASERSKFTIVEVGPGIPDQFVVYRVSETESESGKGFITMMRSHLKPLPGKEREIFDVPRGFSHDSRTGTFGF